MESARNYLGQIVRIKIDRPLGSKHPKHGFIYELNYGFVPGTKAADGEEIDAYLLDCLEPVAETEGLCIAVIHRLNDDDDKLVISASGQNFSDKEINRLTHFQEQWFQSTIIREGTA